MSLPSRIPALDLPGSPGLGASCGSGMVELVASMQRQIGVLKQKVNFYLGSWLISFILVAVASYQLLFSL